MDSVLQSITGTHIFWMLFVLCLTTGTTTLIVAGSLAGTLMAMKLTMEEKLDLVRRLRLIESELESLSVQNAQQIYEISRATALRGERTSLRRQLVADSC